MSLFTFHVIGSWSQQKEAAVHQVQREDRTHGEEIRICKVSKVSTDSRKTGLVFSGITFKCWKVRETEHKAPRNKDIKYEDEISTLMNCTTRMHSSRMRPVRSSDRISGGGVCSGGVCSREVSTPGGCLLGSVCPGGCLLRGGVVSQHALRQTPPPPCGQTDACKNITFATSLRTVKIWVEKYRNRGIL